MIFFRRLRLLYIIAFVLTIFLGLLSRKINGIPLILGDILYATMTYWMFRIIFLNKSPRLIFLLAITFCFTIESLQLIQIEPLIWARNHAILRLVLGQVFLWTDLIAYLIGVTLAYLIDKKYLKFIF